MHLPRLHATPQAGASHSGTHAHPTSLLGRWIEKRIVRSKASTRTPRWHSARWAVAKMRHWLQTVVVCVHAGPLPTPLACLLRPSNNSSDCSLHLFRLLLAVVCQHSGNTGFPRYGGPNPCLQHDSLCNLCKPVSFFPQVSGFAGCLVCVFRPSSPIFPTSSFGSPFRLSLKTRFWTVFGVLSNHFRQGSSETPPAPVQGCSASSAESSVRKGCL